MRALLCFACLFLCCSLFAQGTVHFERPFHVAGEVAWFSAYLPGAATPQKIRVSVHDPAGKQLSYFFIRRAAGSYAGYYRWPFTAATGYYRLRFSALGQDGAVVNLGEVRQPVYSDRRIEGEVAKGRPVAPAATDKSIQLTTEGQRLRVAGLAGQAYSLSIVQDEVAPAASRGVRLLTGGSTATAYLDTLFYPAVFRDAAGNGLATALLPVFDPVTYRFGFSKADAAGRFVYEAGSFEGSKTVYLRDIDERDINATLDVATLPALSEQPPVTAEVANYIDLARRRRKIYQLFSTVETELNVTPAVQERRALNPNRSFQVQDYKQFPDMFNFFKEVAGELRVRQKKENYRARLYNAPNQRFFEGSPLYLIDGRPTRDDNFVMALDPANVEFLGFYYDNRQLRRDFPAVSGSGVVQIETINGLQEFPAADADDALRINGLLPQVTFPGRDAARSEVPAISPVLLWQTGGGQDELTVDLPATDDGGTYRVVLVAGDGSGKVRLNTATFTRTVK